MITFSDSLFLSATGLDKQEFPKGALYIIGLPIGNLADITLRALWTLSTVDVLAAEDTRETHKVLDKFGLHPKLISVREHNEHEGAEKILSLLKEGKRVGLVTDAGTPAISDPGAVVVHDIRAQGYRVIPIPGASAVVTALSASGLEASTYTFVGFLPPQAKARSIQLEKLLAKEDGFVLYEAPHRIKQVLIDLGATSEADRRVVVAREITKKFETFTELKARDLQDWAQSHEPRGEYVVLIDSYKKEKTAFSDLDKQWLNALSKELPASKLAAVGAKVLGVKREVVYQYLIEQTK